MASESKANALTPEQMEEAIAMYKKSKGYATDGADEEPDNPNTDGGGEEDTTGEEPPVTDGADDAPPPPAKGGVEEKLAMVKDRRDRRDADGAPGDMKGAKSVIAQQDEDLDTLTACLEMLLAEKAAKKDEDDVKEDCGGAVKKDGEGNEDCGGANCKDGADDESGSMNKDSADDLIRQRLSICRIGDKLHMDGLEDKSIMDGKKAIIAKVMPGMRLDGRSKAYIDACYDMAVGKVNERKDADYQRRQMAGGRVEASRRSDGTSGVSMASAARQRMLDREEGGKA